MKNSTAKFGEKIKFTKDAPIHFEDFSLTYNGERRVISDLANGSNPSFREFVFYDFKVQTEKEEKTVSWSSGTGDIGPAAFEIGGKKYELELRVSDKLGKLAAAELVVWKK